MLVRSVSSLDGLLTARRKSTLPIGAVLSLEGAHALEGKLTNLDVLYRAGFRMVGLTHFFDNEAGGSAHGMEKDGLTAFGRELVALAQKKNMLIDLAHASPRLIEDVCEMTAAPVVVSHAGVRGTCDSPRNLDDSQVRQIANTGGVVGIAMFEACVGGRTVSDVARAIAYAASLVGVESVALGSDFDGACTTAVDASGLALVTESLASYGFTEGEISRIVGGNILRVLRQVLPV